MSKERGQREAEKNERGGRSYKSVTVYNEIGAGSLEIFLRVEKRGEGVPIVRHDREVGREACEHLNNARLQISYLH